MSESNTVTAAPAPAEAQPNGIVTNLRFVVSAAAELVAGVELVVTGNIRTASDNAREAIEANRARSQARDEMDRLVQALLKRGSGIPQHGRTLDGRTPHGRAPGVRGPVGVSLTGTATQRSR